MGDFEEFKYSPETIRKALDHCSSVNCRWPDDCFGCPLKFSETCSQELMHQAFLYICMLERDNARAMKTKIDDDDFDTWLEKHPDAVIQGHSGE